MDGMHKVSLPMPLLACLPPSGSAGLMLLSTLRLVVRREQLISTLQSRALSHSELLFNHEADAQ